MSDAFESRFQLNPTNAADGPLHFDVDTLVNSNEAALWTDPWVEDTDRDGFKDDADSNALSRAFIAWGEPLYTFGDEYLYTAPLWNLGAWREDGDWSTNPTVAWFASAALSNDLGSLLIAVDRLLLTNDARLDVTTFRGNTGATLFVDLDATNGWTVVTNLFGNLIAAPDTELATNIIIPFAQNPEAALIRLRRGTGEITIHESLLYVDQDGDGLDEDQETQLGTSDFAGDSDADGLNEHAEILQHGTSPIDPDSDHDGVLDGSEIARATDPNDAQSHSIAIAVNSVTGNDAYDGLAAAFDGLHGPKRTLAGAMADARDGDTISVASGTYAAADFRGKDVTVFFGSAVVD